MLEALELSAIAGWRLFELVKAGDHQGFRPWKAYHSLFRESPLASVATHSNCNLILWSCRQLAQSLDPADIGDIMFDTSWSSFKPYAAASASDCSTQGSTTKLPVVSVSTSYRGLEHTSSELWEPYVESYRRMLGRTHGRYTLTYPPVRDRYKAALTPR